MAQIKQVHDTMTKSWKQAQRFFHLDIEFTIGGRTNIWWFQCEKEERYSTGGAGGMRQRLASLVGESLIDVAMLETQKKRENKESLTTK
jgi:hypothetical protein